MAKILIVDDSGFMRMLIKQDLLRSGFTDIYEAADGLQAIEKYKDVSPDLVLMDITMPNMDGLEALKNIKAMDSKAVVVMCSAMGQQIMMKEAIKLGARDFIIKPFKKETIQKTIGNLLQLK